MKRFRQLLLSLAIMVGVLGLWACGDNIAISGTAGGSASGSSSSTGPGDEPTTAVPTTSETVSDSGSGTGNQSATEGMSGDPSTTSGSGSGSGTRTTSASDSDSGTSISSSTTGMTTDSNTTQDTDGSSGTTGSPGICGNTVVENGEECDDGNQQDEDFCSNDCNLPVCGNGIVQGDEECDDGNTTVDDGCEGCRVSVAGLCVPIDDLKWPNSCFECIEAADECCDLYQACINHDEEDYQNECQTMIACIESSGWSECLGHQGKEGWDKYVLPLLSCVKKNPNLNCMEACEIPPQDVP